MFLQRLALFGEQMETDVDHGQMSGGTIEDAKTASEADVIADLTGGVPSPAPAPDAPTPADPAASADGSLDPNPKPIFGTVPEGDAEPPPATEEKTADAVTEDLSTEDTAKLKDFVDKNYAGSMQAFIDGLYATRNSNANVHQELSSLKEQVGSFMDAFNKEADDAPVTSPDLEEFDDNLKSLSTEAEDLQKTHYATLLKINEADRGIASLEGEMRRASEDDQETLSAKKDRLEDRKETLISKLDDLSSRSKSKQTEIKRTEKAKTRAEKAAKDRRVSDTEVQTREQEQSASIESYFVDRVAKEAKQHELDSDDTREMEDVVRAELMRHLKSLPSGSPTVNMDSFVAARAKAHVARQEAKADRLLKKRSAGRKPASTPHRTSPTGTKPPVTDPNLNTRSGPWDAQFSRNRARKVLGD